MPKPPANWPSGALPLGLDVEMAAYYVNLSVTTFLQRVKAGVYPEPKRDGKRCIWDREKLHDAFVGKAASNDAGFFDPDGQAKALETFRARRAAR